MCFCVPLHFFCCFCLFLFPCFSLLLFVFPFSFHFCVFLSASSEATSFCAAVYPNPPFFVDLLSPSCGPRRHNSRTVRDTPTCSLHRKPNDRVPTGSPRQCRVHTQRGQQRENNRSNGVCQGRGGREPGDRKVVPAYVPYQVNQLVVRRG